MEHEGATVGFGFAAFESAGYAFTALFTERGLSLLDLVQTELLRGVLFTGFPWNLLGTVWAFDALPLQAAAWIGVHGLSLLTAIMVLAPLARRGWWVTAAGMLCGWLLTTALVAGLVSRRA